MTNLDLNLNPTTTETTSPTTILIDLENEQSSINSELLPIQKMNELVDTLNLTDNETSLRNDIIIDIEKAQYHTVSAMFYYIIIGGKLITVKSKLTNQRFLSFINSIGFSERTAQRYCKIAKDKRFAQLTENEIRKIHHLTQSKMVTMTKFNDKKFNDALTDEDFEFPSNKKIPKKPTDCVIDDELYTTFMKADKAYVINEYNSLSQYCIELEEKIEAINSDNNSALYLPKVEKEVA